MARDQLLLDGIENDILTSRPIAETLRKCVVLGGKAGSVELRDWATRELRGYALSDEVPEYRTVGAPLFVNAVTGRTIVTRQQIGVTSLPEPVRDDVDEQLTLRQGIGEIEAMVLSAERSDKGAVDFSLPMASEIGSIMDRASGNRFQQITALYWSVSSSTLHGVVDHVRTTLAELVAEMRAGMPYNEVIPSAEVANQAVSVAINGERARVTVQTAQTDRASSANFGPREDSPFWTRSRRVGAFVAGTASIVALAIAIGQMRGWF